MNFDIKKIFENFSHFHSVISMIAMLIGKGDAVPSDDFGKFSGFAGIFGKKDEAKLFVSLLNKGLNDEERKTIVDFIIWYQRRYSPGPANWILIWWWSNAWRTFATINLYIDPQKVGTRKVTWKDDAGKEHTTTKDIFEGGSSYTVIFLKHIASLIGDPATEEGYEKVLREFEAIGVPRLPEPETVDWINEKLTSIPELGKYITKLNDLIKKVGKTGYNFSRQIPDYITTAEKKLRRQRKKTKAQRPKGFGWLWALIGG